MKKAKSEHPTSNIQLPTSNSQHPTSNVSQRMLAGDQTETKRATFDLEERMLAHAARIVRLCDSVSTSTSVRTVTQQLVRSGTSPYLHHGEVEAAESLRDFVHKLKVCLKELRETWRGLRFLQAVNAISDRDELDSLIDETQQLIRIFWKSVKTARSRRGESSARVAEDTPLDDDWMLDVGCWVLDVNGLIISPDDLSPEPEVAVR